MAEAIALYDAADVIEPSSAGLNPMGSIPELTRQILERNGYTAKGLNSTGLTRELSEAADIIINMSGEPLDEEPENKGKVEDWMVQDPYGATAHVYQRVFEGIQRRVNQLAEGLREKRQHPTTVR